METGPWLKASSDRLVKPGIEPATPGLQGKRFIHFTTAAPVLKGKQILHSLPVWIKINFIRQLLKNQRMLRVTAH